MRWKQTMLILIVMVVMLCCVQTTYSISSHNKINRLEKTIDILKDDLVNSNEEINKLNEIIEEQTN